MNLPFTIKHYLQLSLRRNRLLWLEYSVIAMVVIVPLLSPGYILTLDMVFTPKLPLSGEVGNTYLFQTLLHYLNYLVPSQVIEKIILFLILILAGTGMHRLVQYHLQKHTGDTQWGAYFAGIFYMLNPFTYTRFMAGHYLFLLGYALLPFFVLALLRFIEKPGLKSSIKLLGWALGISVISIHTVGFMALLAIMAFAVTILKLRKHGKSLRKFLKYGLMSVVIFMVASSYWLIPFATGQSSNGRLLSNFDQRHAEFFKTVGDAHVGLPGNVLGLYGFWGDDKGIYALPKAQIPWWPILLIMLLVLAGVGARSSWRKDRHMTVVIAASGVLALVMALGIAFGPVAPLNRWLTNYIPLFSGYREPQKFVALLALAEAYFCGIGLSRLIELIRTRKPKLENWKLQLVCAFCLLLPFIYTPTMLWGFNRQLKAVDYPRDWYALNERLNQDRDNFKVLFLPWHQYMKFDFAGRVIANPANIFFDRPVIQGDNAEFGEVFREVSNPVNEDIENRVLRPGDNAKEAGVGLAQHKIKYIILAKEVDWQDYDFLNHQSDLQLLEQTPNLIVYENKSFEPENP